MSLIAICGLRKVLLRPKHSDESWVKCQIQYSEQESIPNKQIKEILSVEQNKQEDRWKSNRKTKAVL